VQRVVGPLGRIQRKVGQRFTEQGGEDEKYDEEGYGDANYVEQSAQAFPPRLFGIIEDGLGHGDGQFNRKLGLQ
jgi:hypothetical protein